MNSLLETNMLEEGIARFANQEEQLSKTGILGTVDTKLVKGALPLVSNAIAKELQQTILDQQFTYCDVEKCGILHSDTNAESYFNSIRRKEIFLNVCLNLI